MQQHVACRFNFWDKKTYTYIWEGDEPLKIDDRVVVETNRGPMIIIIVADVNVTPPEGITLKKIKSKCDPKDDVINETIYD